MEAASCSTLHSLRLSPPIQNNLNPKPRNILRNLQLGRSFSSNFPKEPICFRGIHHLLNGFWAASSDSASGSQNPSLELAVLLQVDGVLMDAYRSGNRQSFNVAFRKLGLDCANWAEPIYVDLLRKSGGDEEKMLIGWPSSLPTSEKNSFVKSVLREKKNALDEFAASTSSSLRPGVENFIGDALDEDIPVVILTAYGKSEEKIARSIVDKLGQEIVSKVQIVGKEEVWRSLYGQLVLGKVLLSGAKEELAKEAIKAGYTNKPRILPGFLESNVECSLHKILLFDPVSAEKQRIAEEVASLLKLSVELDTSSSESLQKIVAALRAGAEYAGVPVSNCVLVAGTQTGLAAAVQIAMPCIILRSSLTARAEFPAAKAVVDGFGGADLTTSKLKNKLQS